MNITIHRGTHEIGGTIIELQSDGTRILLDAGYPLFLDGKPIDNKISKLAPAQLLRLGVLPDIKGLYSWDKPSFDAVLISHAHIDHYGLLKYVNPAIPIYMSRGASKIIELSKTFNIADVPPLDFRTFKMYKSFSIAGFIIKPYLMDHSAFDAAAFEVSDGERTVIYTGDFRGHGRKQVCLDRFIKSASNNADMLLTEGTMMTRQTETIKTEQELEDEIVALVQSNENLSGPVLFQTSSQNIDRLVGFFRAACRLRRLFVVDVYIANVLYELRQLGNKIPYPSTEYPYIRVFFPWRLTNRVFKQYGEEYATRFRMFRISKSQLKKVQGKIVMAVRASMKDDLKIAGIENGLFIYSMWNGYRVNDYQHDFETFLIQSGFKTTEVHTSGHAKVTDIQKVISALAPKMTVPIHTMSPELFVNMADNVELKEDKIAFTI